MYIYLTIFLSIATLLGHSIVGKKQYLDKMLAVKFDPIAKRMLTFGFYYVSTTLFITALFYIYVLAFSIPLERFQIASFFIAAQFGAITLLHIFLSSTSGFKKWSIIFYHWIPFLAITISSALSGIA